MRHRKVVVTGLGMVTPIGLTRDASWQAMLAGRSGVRLIESFPTDGFRTRIAAEVPAFDPGVVLSPKEVRKTDRYCQMALVAADEAMQQAAPGDLDATRAGVIIGSGIGGMITFESQHRKLLEEGPNRISPLFIPMMIADMASGLVSIRYGYRGPNFATVSACASSGHAIAAAFDHIRTGKVDVMITGGAEASVCATALAGFGAMKAISTRNDDPAAASRPFDRDRDGFVLGEGAGILILEAAEYAEARGAEILAEVAGYGSTADAYHITQPEGDGIGASKAMANALQQANVQTGDIDYINAHGTSTYYNDKIETKAIKDLFGDHAYRLAVSSNKSMIGHLLGAAGGVECAATVLSLKHGIQPPTINLETPDPECDLDYCPQKAVERHVECALSNSFGFGGHNVSLCLKAWH
jgi:3-oxoacyl-[acyl-carrier-protein] synthase II